MKIISKYKDYYDYLIGVYGEDPKLILDRTDWNKHNLIPETKYTLHFCGWAYDFYYNKNKEILYMKDAFDWCKENINNINNLYKYNSTIPYFFINRDILYTDKYKSDTNEKYDCPIILSTMYNYNLWPVLKDLEFNKIKTAEEVFIELSSYLSSIIDKRLEVKETLTDKQKINVKGFNDKTSFRPKMKKK